MPKLTKNNNTLLVFGPHATINDMGEMVSSSNEEYLAVKNGTNTAPIFERLPMEYLNQMKNKNTLQTALIHETYNLIAAQIATLDKSKGKVAVLGGITLAIENSTSIFLPLMF